MGTCMLLYMIIERKWKGLSKTNIMNVSKSNERLLRCQWWCLDSVGVRGSNPRLKCHRQPRKIRDGSLESGRMGNTSPAAEPLRRYSTRPQIWRIARQEVAPQTPHPAWSGELMGGPNHGFFSSLFMLLGSNVRLNAVGSLAKSQRSLESAAGWQWVT